MENLSDLRNIMVTGASRGIGRECAIALAGPDVRLVLHARSEEAMAETAAVCKAKGADVVFWPLDLSDIASLDQAMSTLVEQIGPIHTLVNNAGIWIEKPFAQGDMDLWDQALDVNLKAVIHLCRQALEQMPEGGAMVFIASAASKRSYANGTNYCAAKWGLAGFAGALFEDIRARGIKVCTLFPGVVNTDMHAQDASFAKELMIQPQDIAQAVAWVLGTPSNICPTELVIQPQKIPKIKI